MAEEQDIKQETVEETENTTNVEAPTVEKTEEAMADAAVVGGMPRKQAYNFAAQSVLGAAKMVLESGKHPGELKDMVCSPGGTTIEAVKVLENEGMRSSVINAVCACIEKSKEMSK